MTTMSLPPTHPCFPTHNTGWPLTERRFSQVIRSRVSVRAHVVGRAVVASVTVTDILWSRPCQRESWNSMSKSICFAGRRSTDSCSPLVPLPCPFRTSKKRRCAALRNPRCVRLRQKRTLWMLRRLLPRLVLLLLLLLLFLLLVLSARLPHIVSFHSGHFVRLILCPPTPLEEVLSVARLSTVPCPSPDESKSTERSHDKEE
jgi:hypothetical protein